MVEELQTTQIQEMIDLVGQEAKLGLRNDNTLKNLLKFIIFYALSAYNEDEEEEKKNMFEEENKNIYEEEKATEQLKKSLHNNPKMINVLGILYKIVNQLLKDSESYKEFAADQMNYLREKGERSRSSLEDKI